MKRSGRVVFQPSGRAVEVDFGTPLSVAAEQAGLALNLSCGGKGTCGKCLVIVHGGDCPPSPVCEERFNGDQLAMGMRLACQCKVGSDCIVEVPPESLIDKTESKILTSGNGEPLEVSPPVAKFHFHLDSEAGADGRSDLIRLEALVGMPLRPELSALRELPDFLRDNDFAGTAVVRNGGDLVALEKGDTRAACFGVAFDVGTTTVVGTLMDLSNGREAGVAARLNPQISYGDDVVSRIQKIREEPDALIRMQDAIIGVVNEILQDVAKQGGIKLEDIYDICMAGNTTMQHIFCGISPRALGEVPFPPAFSRHMTFTAGELGIVANPVACAYVFPNVGGFVGGDTVAGITSATLDQVEEPVIFVDIGTNGEIVLARRGEVLATSTAAGPAFEGARIANGMRATEGAIEKVWLENGDISFNVIGTRQASGICGTALIDLIAALLECGLIDTTGRLLCGEELPDSLPDGLRRRVALDSDGQPTFQIVRPEQSARAGGVILCQRDIREVQLASGAIRAGVSIIMRQAGVSPAEVGQVLLAGAFGNYIRRENACRIGLLPDLPLERITFIGNASSTGAKMALLSHQARERADRIAASTRHVDLSADPEFQMEFGMAMMFPQRLG